MVHFNLASFFSWSNYESDHGKGGAGKQGKVDRLFASSDGNRRNAAGGRRIKETLNLPWIVSLHRKMVWVLYDIFTKEN